MSSSGFWVRTLASALVGTVVSLSCVAAEITWVGGLSGVWSNPANWSGGVPGAGDNAIIATAGAAITVDTAVEVTSITINRGATGVSVNIAAGVTLYLSNLGTKIFESAESCEINGPGMLKFSTSAGINYADLRPAADTVLTINAKVVANGSSGVENNGHGVVLLTNPDSDFVGDVVTTKSDGIVEFVSAANKGVASPLGMGSALICSQTRSGYRFVGAAAAATDRTIEVRQARGVLEQTGTAAITFSGVATNIATATLILRGDVATPGFFSGTVADGGGKFSLTKQGLGTWVLNGNNSATGVLSVEDGVLELGGSINFEGITLVGGTLKLLSGAMALPEITVGGAARLDLRAAGGSVTLPGISADGPGWLDILADDPVFISGAAAGALPGVLLNGKPAGYDEILGVVVIGGNTPLSLKALGPDMIVDDADVAAVIDQLGSSGGIALEKELTTIYSLRQEVGAATAYVDLAGGTLAASKLEIDSAGGDLVLGDGGYVTAPASGTAPAGAATFPTLSGAPLIWYDFADTGSVTTNMDGRIATVANLGSAGAVLDAGSNAELLGPLYVESGIRGQMVARTDSYKVSQGLDSLNTTGIGEKSARTFFVVAKRLTMTDKNFYAVFMGEESTHKAFGVSLQRSDLVFMSFSNDINLTAPPNGFNVYCFTTGLDEEHDKGAAFVNGEQVGEKTFNLNTTDTRLRLMNRPNLESNNVSGPGELGEFLLFNRTLDSGERSEVAAYLMQKWGVSNGQEREQTLLTINNESESSLLDISASVSDPYGGYLSLVKDGVGASVIRGNPSYSGFTDIKGGELIVDIAAGGSDILAGVIRGSGSLVKQGGGVLTLSQSGSYRGGTVVRDGTLMGSRNDAFGSGAIVVEDGAALDIKHQGISGNHAVKIGNKVIAAGDGPDGLGGLRYSDSKSDSQHNAFVDVTMSGDLSVFAGGRFDVREGSFDFGGHKLTVNGGSVFALVNNHITGVTEDTGVYVADGEIRFEVSDFQGSALNVVEAAAGAGVGIYSQSIPIEWSARLQDNAYLYANNGGTSSNFNIWAGPVELASGTVYLTTPANCSLTLTGEISGSGSLHKRGAGSEWLLNRSNSYAGTTSVSNGALYTVAEGSLGAQGKSGLTVSDSGTLIARVASDGWTQGQVLDLLDGSVFVTPRTTTLGIELLEGDMVLDEMVNIGLAKYGPYKLTLTDEVPDMGGIRVYEGELDISNTGEHYLEKQSVVIGAGNTGSGVAVLRMPGASLLTEDPGYNRAGPTITVGDVSGSRAVLYMDEDSELYGRLMVGSQGGSAGAVYQSGGTVVNTGGDSNEAVVGGSGYGYYRLDGGLLANKGNTRLTRSSGSVGIYEQYGGEGRINIGSGTLPGTGDYDEYYNGIISARRGVARFLVAGGVFNHNNHTFQLGEWNSGDKVDGDSSLTIEGSGEVYGLLRIVMADRNDNCEAYLNLNGGVLSTPFFLKGGNNESNNNARAAIGLNGGLLRVETGDKSVELVQTGKDNAPPVVTVYSGGARIEVPEAGDASVLSEPLQAPIGAGVSGITVTGAGAGYIGPPAVQIKGGGGFGATALAEINPLTGEVTGIRVTSPGSGYSSVPSVALSGGGFVTAATATAQIGSNVLTGGLTKLGQGTLELAAANTYYGATLVSEGVLRLAGGTATLPAGSAVTISGGTLDMGGEVVTNVVPVVLEEGALLNGMLAGGVTKAGSGTAVFAAGALIPGAAEQRDAAIAALQPLIWYDPADSSTITLDGNDRVVRMRNKGSLGSTHDAVPIVAEGSTKYLTGSSSISPLGAGVLHIDNANARMNSENNLPIIGTAPRTLVAVLARSGSGSSNRGVVGMGSGNEAQTFEIGVDAGKTYVSGIGGGRDTDIKTNIPGTDQLAVVAGANGYDGNLSRGVTVWRSIGSGWDMLNDVWPANMGTAVAKLHIGRRTSSVYQGKVGAVLLFDRRLEQEELDVVCDALVAKYLIAPEDDDDEYAPGVHVAEGTLRLAADASAIAALGPVLWYDPSDSETVTLDGSGKVSALANKGSMGAGMDAVSGIVNGGVALLSPALAEGSSSYAKSGLPMLSVSANNEGLSSSGNTGITGSAPRTVAGVYARHDNKAGPIVAFGRGSHRMLFEVGDRENGNIVGCFGDNADLIMLPTNPIQQANVIIGANIDSNMTACWRTGVSPNYKEFTLGGDLDTEDSRIVIGQRIGVKDRSDFKGQIGEVLVFNRLLSEEERLLVQEYLSAKWMHGATPDHYYSETGFEVASGATLDLNGERSSMRVSGSGSIVNGSLGNGFVISPAGDAGIGTLSFSGVTFGEGVTYRLTATATESDKIEVSGDLSGMTIVPATEDEPTGGSYTVATGTITGKPALDGFPEKYKLILRGSELVLTREGGTLMLLR